MHIEKKKNEAIDTAEKRGSLGNRLAKGIPIYPLSAPLQDIHFPKENGCQGQVVAGIRGDQRQKWRCLEWYYNEISIFFSKSLLLFSFYQI